MSVIIRLQNLPISATSGDIRHFFRGLRIPDGGVHIIGGEKGIVFVAFKSDEDARIAMRKDGWKIDNNKIKLYLSSHMEMMHEIEQLMKRESNVFQSQTHFNKYNYPNKTAAKDVRRDADYNIKDYLSYSSDEDSKTHPYETLHLAKRDRSPLDSRSRLMEEPPPLRQRSHSPNLRSRSPNTGDSKTILRREPRSQIRQRSRSPYNRRSRSPFIARSRSPYTRSIRSPNIRRSRSPNIRRSRSPYIDRSQSPYIRRSQLSYERRSPSVKRSLSPYVEMSKSQYLRSPSHFIRRSRSPMAERPGSPCIRSRSPFQQRSQSPPFKSSWLSSARETQNYFDSNSGVTSSAYHFESDRRPTKSDHLRESNYISEQLFRGDDFETDTNSRLSLNEEQRQLEEKISKALNTKFVENAFGISSKPEEDFDISLSVTQHVPDYYKSQEIPFINDFPNPSETTKLMGANESYQPFNPISEDMSLNISPNDQQNFYDNQMLPPFQDQSNISHPSSSIFSASVFPQSPALHISEMTPMSLGGTPNFSVPFTGYYVSLSGLDPFWTDGEVQSMLKGIFAPQANIRWELNDHGFKTGVVFVKVLNKDDFDQIILYPTFVFNNRVISVAECPNYIYEKYFPPPTVPPLPEQMIVKDGDLYYKLKALPYSVTIEEIIQFFYGFHIADVYIEETGGKRTGIGYVGFATYADYDRARIMHNKKMQHMFVQLVPCTKQDVLNAKKKYCGYFSPTSLVGPAYNPISSAPKRPLCAAITGVPSFTKIPRLLNYFKEKGLKPRAIHSIVSNNRGSLGRGFVEFSNIRDFDAALKCHGEEINNKMICVKQILYDEMNKILGVNKTRHHYEEEDTNLYPFQKEPEKAPYIWDPPDQDSSPQKSLNTFNALPNNISINTHNTNMQFENLDNQQNNAFLNSSFENNSATSNYNRTSKKKMKNKWHPSNIRNPVRFEVKIKPSIVTSKKTDEVFDKTNKEDKQQKLTKLTPEKENPKLSHEKSVFKNDEKIQTFKSPVVSKQLQDAVKVSKPALEKDGVKMQDSSKMNKPTFQKNDVVKEMEGSTSKSTLKKEDGVKKSDCFLKSNSKPVFQTDNGSNKREQSSKVSKPASLKDSGNKKLFNRSSNPKSNKGNDLHFNRESRVRHSPSRRGRSPSPRKENRRQYSPNFRRGSIDCPRKMSPGIPREVVIQMSNVPPHIGEAELRDFFRGFDIQEKMSRRYGGNGEPLGDIRVTVSSRREAERVIKYLDGLTLNGSIVHMMIVD